MSRHAIDTTTTYEDDVRAASERWWTAHEGGAGADEVQQLWEELNALCSARPIPSPEDQTAESRFGWAERIPAMPG